MNTNTSGAVLLLLLGISGLLTGNPPVYLLAAAAAAFAFLAEDLGARWVWTAGSFAIASWGAVGASFYFLLVN